MYRPTIYLLSILFALALLHGTTSYAQTSSISDTDLLHQIDQMIMIGFRGESIAQKSDIMSALATSNLGGVILFDYDTPSQKYTRNISSPRQTRQLISELQKHSKTPLFVALDEEGGRVSRLKSRYGFSVQLPAAATMSRWSNNYLSNRIKRHALYLQSLGFNTNFAPVVDLAINPLNPAVVIHKRSFGKSADVVTTKADTITRSYSANNILTSLKHFPGHGSSTTDSHKQFVDITNTHSDNEYIPYRELCARNTPSVMIGHLFDSSVDPLLPASLSKPHIDKLNSLGCTQQLVVSDDYDMRAIRDNYSIDQIVTYAINAGVDVLIFSNNIHGYDPALLDRVRTAILDGVKNGTIPADRITESYNKIQETKRLFDIIQ